MERSSGKWRQDVERRVLDACRFEEVHRLLKNRLSIMIEAKDDSCLHGHAVRVNPLDGARVLIHAVERFRNLVDACLRNGFKPDEQLFAATARGQLEELVVFRRINTRLAAPPFAERRQGSEERLGVLHVGGNIVVPHDDDLAAKGSVLARDGFDRTVARLALVHHRQGAEIALMRATARREQNAVRMVATMKQVVPRDRSLIEGRGFEAAVACAVPPGFELRQELRPFPLGFSDKDHVGVRLRFIGHQGDVRSAQRHRDSALPKAGCHLVDVRRAGSVERDRNQVCRGVKVDRFHNFVDMAHRPMRRHKCGQVRHGDLLKVQDAVAPRALRHG